MPTKTAKKGSNLVVARDAITITVGARPIEYGKITVRDRRTGELVEIDDHDVMVDEGDEGVPYAFKAFQKVNKKHPAVKANPGAFIPLDEVDEADLIEV
jgi:hypothetical protein